MFIQMFRKKLDGPEAISEWVAERKRRWPSLKRKQDKVRLLHILESVLFNNVCIRIGERERRCEDSWRIAHAERTWHESCIILELGNHSCLQPSSGQRTWTWTWTRTRTRAWTWLH